MTLRLPRTIVVAAVLLAGCREGGELREATERRRAMTEQFADSAAEDSVVADTDTDTAGLPDEDVYEIPPFLDTTLAAGGDPAPADTAPAPPVDVVPERRASPGWSVGRTRGDHRVPGIALLRDWRVGRNEGFDRLVLEFGGGRIPAWEVEYRDRLRQCGSGDAVQAPGTAALVVRLRVTQAHTDEGEATLSPRRLRPDLPVLKGVQLLCDFEGEVEVVLGLDRRVAYRVDEISNPARLIIDVQQ